MKPLVLSIFALMALGACGQTVATAPQTDIGAETNAADGCAVSVTTPWRPLSGVEFKTTATTIGATCAEATATLRISYGADQTLYSQDFPTAQVMVLAPAQDNAEMETALTEWLDQSRNVMPTTAQLPPWPAGAAQPAAGEFPFYPEEGVTQAAYEAWRRTGAPMFCFVQGMESMACLAWRDGAMTKIGVQSFPG